ncbi:MAG: hypothetical protein A2X94_16160 [Bdellovibrionales bacterium GWB1_55_8]|nr:MAG: hypothetical protein A2X94_16160 [Bdellovibrionales bacterium GWB1_55_8]
MKPTSEPKNPADPSGGRSIYQGVLQPTGFPGLPSGWVSQWETFAATGPSPLQLFAVTHHPSNWSAHPAPYRVLLVFHGLGEHGGRYLHLPHYLQDAVSAVQCVDFRGHGRSEGLRGDIKRFDDFVDDLILSVHRMDEQLKRRFGRSEIHVFGHSMGALVALRAFFQDPGIPVASATLSSPLLGIRVKVPPVKRGAAFLLSKVWGSLHLISELNPEELSHDRAVSEAYVADRLVHRKVTSRFYFELLSAVQKTAQMARKRAKTAVPLQFLAPLEDRIVDSDTVIRFYHQLKHKIKELRTYDGFFHESVNEMGKEAALEDIKKWILKNAAPS